MGIFSLIYWVFVIFQLIILARVLLSWFPNIDRYNPIVKFIYDVTEPVLRPIRNVLPQNLPFDFSPLILLLIVNVLLQIIF
jgi:YggT family protein